MMCVLQETVVDKNIHKHAFFTKTIKRQNTQTHAIDVFM